MELKQETTHVVIVFLAPCSRNQPRQVDLVPRSWLVAIEGQWFSQYPPPEDYSKIDKWVKVSKLPNFEWSSELVRIVKEADSYHEGLRRSERSYTNSNVESTSTAEEDNNQKKNRDVQQPIVLNNEQKIMELDRAPTIDETISTEADDSSEVIESDPSKTLNTPKQFSNLNTMTPKSHTQRSLTPRSHTPRSHTPRSLTPRSHTPRSHTPRSHTPRPRIVSNIRVDAAASESSEEGGENDQPESDFNSQQRSRIKSKLPSQKRNNVPVTRADTSDEQTSSPATRKRNRVHPDGKRAPIHPKNYRETIVSRDEPSQLEEKLKRIEERIVAKIDSAKRSVLYDIDKKAQEIKNTLTMTSGTLGMNVTEQRKTLNIELPVRDLESFLEFDALLQTAPDKEQALLCTVNPS